MIIAKSIMGVLFIMLISGMPVILAQSTSGIYIAKKNLVTFNSKTQTELIKASSSELKGIIDSEKRIFAFTVAMKTFDGFNSPLQKEHFNENYMESEKFPIEQHSR